MGARRLRRLSDHVRLVVGYRDGTRYGSALGGVCDALIHHTCRDVCSDLGDAAEQRVALSRCFEERALGQLYASPGVLRDACLYPDPSQVLPNRLRIEIDGRQRKFAQIELDGALASDLASWISAWTRGASAPQLPGPRRLWDAFDELGIFTEQPLPSSRLDDGLTFVGHATMLLRSQGVCILVDPFLLPMADGRDYRPLLAPELSPDAILITHSHPDHFDAGSLLRLGRDIPIYVAAVARESLLTVDMHLRLQQLGFRRVHTLAWGERATVGTATIHAYPLYGEQPTDGAMLHPEVRNVGNTYVVETGDKRRFAFIADAGRDDRGSAIALAREEQRHGRTVDVVCGGYRAWRLFPSQYVFSSVARYLLFVPPSAWGHRMQIMNDARDLYATAEAWGARWVVPYANGGAPWYWKRGLGPDLARHGSPIAPDFDPDLSPLADEAARRDRDAPTIAALHPGERLQWTARGEVVRVVEAGFVWPYGDQASHDLRARVPTRGGAADAVA